ncbi:MAG: Holliday junction branch migration protein RuvA [Tepidiphilus sp.]|jgi:Holliday junction DNA helicase RuvA|uniref:Holliday junction branch migration complex subunit RuvA n=1 Tax=Tepidiphilus thermophilus TaxID=876478 RepID=A0A0K6IVI4_9PROT|nr:MULTISPECIES: Holliday junction branch migration protein RuvA [Tepidiphilus]MBP6998292.1 Holliday junction branch migration protein RuvA [Tepidiphilus sp.]CUB07120.1 Holliday junction DNA helicase subunit RuvA [Tepidiphilus thermophilus]
MIGLVRGIVREKTPPQILVDTGAVGYELLVPMSTFYTLPAIGQEVTLRTHLLVREDEHQLYGFATEEERHAFRQLIRIAGIGARTALAILSGLSVRELREAVLLQDGGRLVKIPGIGKKTAERLLLELKDKTGALLPTGHGTAVPAGSAPHPANSPEEAIRAEIVAALLALGYSEREALRAVSALPPQSDTATGIRLALKALAPGG